MDVQTFRIQAISIVGSAILFLFIIELLRKKKLREEYSLLWLFGSVIFLVLSVWRDLLTLVSVILGIAYPPAALFLILIMGVYLMALHFSLVLSTLTAKNKTVIQELALLKHELEGMREIQQGRAGERQD